MILLKLLYYFSILQLSNSLPSSRRIIRQVKSNLKARANTLDLDWKNLQFEYLQTNSFAKCTYKNGNWGEIEIVQGEPYIPIHIGATALHYGQACFEGLKAFSCKDGSIQIFRPDENARRMEESCQRICMQPFPRQRFIEACREVVKDNLEYVPPYGTGGSMYIRPILFGSGPRIGLKPADEYTLVIMVIPVGDYYQGGVKAVKAKVVDDYDRAATKGVGNVKVAGNYAADLLPNMLAKKEGFPVCLYLDAKTNSFIEEFSTSNFIAIDKKGSYLTPKSSAILGSITNKSLMQLAYSEGIDVQHRQVHVDELSTFSEVAACGTAVVVTPIESIFHNNKEIVINKNEGFGPVIKNLYTKIRQIQVGDIPDPFNWMFKL